MMKSQNLKFADSPKTQKSKYLEDETFFLQIKKFIHQKLYGKKNNNTGDNL